MKILLLLHALPLDPDQVVTGNAVRAYAFEQALLRAGHQVHYAYPSVLGRHTPVVLSRGASAEAFATPRQLEQQIHHFVADAVLVCYWDLLEQLPPTLDIPIVLDMVAPRLLEAVFEDHADLGADARRMLSAFRRPWRFLVGSTRQRDFLIPWLLMAGVDCSGDIPVDVVAIASEVASEPAPRPGRMWRFVTGGVDWPWRNSETRMEVLQLALNQAQQDLGKSASLMRLGGNSAPVDAQSPTEQNQGLLPYRELRALLHDSAVGVELALPNVERHFSQSFRAVECLCAGIPVMVDAYLELADAVRQYDAGWVVEESEPMVDLVRNILSDPRAWSKKAANALRLARDQHAIHGVTVPLLRWLASPSRPVLNNPLLAPRMETAVEDNRLQILGRLFRDWVYERFTRPLYARVARYIEPRLMPVDGNGKALVVVTRRDVFPPNHGAAVKIERTAWSLSFRFDAVVLITDDRSCFQVCSGGTWETRKFPWWLPLLAPPRFLVRLCCVHKHIPLDNAFLYFPLCDRSYNLRTLYAATQYPVVAFQAEFPAYVKAFLWARNLFGRRIVMVEHNVEYQRVKNQVAALSGQGYRTLRDMEIEFANACNAVVTVSEEDRACLLADGVDASRLHVIPHGVDLDAYANVTPIDLRARYGLGPDVALLVYHGTYEYQPNLDAVRFLAAEIVPRLARMSVAAHVIAVGRLPLRPWVHDAVTFSGPVEALAPYLCAADVAVVPLMDGGGTRMKVLDYFAARVPVVITSKGIEGIPVVSGEQLLIEDDTDGFAEAVARVLQQSELAKSLIVKAHAYVQSLDWRELSAAYAELLLPGTRGNEVEPVAQDE